MSAARNDVFRRRTGVLLHPTSLPGAYGVGGLGREARHFVDWLVQAGVSVWQVLPLVPPGAGDSPYSSPSAFAGNALMVDLETLQHDGLLSAEEAADRVPASERVNFAAVRAFKLERLGRASARLSAGDLAAYRAQAPWVDAYALFEALSRTHHGQPWWTWPAELRDFEPSAVESARAHLRSAIDRVVGEQLLFDRQWRALRAYASDRGVLIMGDMPIYVDANSADVWAHQAMFQLAPDGSRPVVSGVPPDAFSDLGQLWGNPLYDWSRMAQDGYAWWVDRVRRVLKLTDMVRIDHFRAFAAYWEVPGDALDARGGRWVQGPGRAVFDALRAALGPLPIVAEDLGVIDEPVRELLAATGLPGMKILQFAFGDGPANPYLPHNHVPNSVVYTGTHDNETTLGWWQSTHERVRDRVRRYYGISGNDVVWDLVRSALESVACLAIVPMQDVLTLDNGARMNTPSVAEGNWGWRLRAGDLRDDVASRLRGLSEQYGRT